MAWSGPTARIVSAQHGDFVAEYQDLDVFAHVESGKQRQPAQHAGEHQIGESEGHSERSCCAGHGPDREVSSGEGADQGP